MDPGGVLRPEEDRAILDVLKKIEKGQQNDWESYQQEVGRSDFDLPRAAPSFLRSVEDGPPSGDPVTISFLPCLWLSYSLGDATLLRN